MKRAWVNYSLIVYAWAWANGVTKSASCIPPQIIVPSSRSRIIPTEAGWVVSP